MHPRLLALLKYMNIDVHYGQLREVPEGVIYASLLLSLSAVSQWLVDLLLEIASHVELIPAIPFRINFISLTFISALLAMQTFKSLRHTVLKVTTSALHVAFLVEMALVIGDMYFLWEHGGNTFLFYFRLPFIVLTTINIGLIMYMWLVISPHRHHVRSIFNPSYKKPNMMIGE